MKILKSKRKNYTMSLEVEASTETLNSSMDVAFKELVKSAKIPGFRKGKVPRKLFEDHYGKEMIIQEGINKTVNKTYIDAIQELKLEVVDYPKNINIKEYKEDEPISFSCEVDVKPEVKLGKYKSLKVTKESSSVSDEEVLAQLSHYLENLAEYIIVERAVQKDDVIRLNLSTKMDAGEPYEPWSRNNLGMKVGLGIYGEPFDEKIIGLNPKEKSEFSLPYDDNFKVKDVAGKTLSFEAEVTEIREKKLPEWTDAIAEKVSEFKTVQELQNNTRAKLETDKEKHIEEKLRTDLLQQVIDNSSVDIPNGMVEQEIDNTIKHYEQTLKQSGNTIETYIKMIGKDMKDFREDLRTDAGKSVKLDLVVEALVEKENPEVSDEELKDEVRKLIPNVKDDKEIEEQMARLNIEGFRKLIQRRKVVDYIKDHAKIKKK